MIEKITLFIILSFIYFNGNTQTVYLTHQEEVNNFNIDFPNPENIENLYILSDEIFNLDSLYKIGHYLSSLLIENTEITTVNGLRNLNEVGVLSIRGNKLLNNIQPFEKLSYIDRLFIEFSEISEFPYFENLDYIYVIQLQANHKLINIDNLNNLNFNSIRLLANSQLNNCAINSVCEHLINHGNYNIQSNGPNCESKESILENCESYEGCDFNNVILLEEFESFDISDTLSNYITELDTILTQNGEIINLNVNCDSSFIDQCTFEMTNVSYTPANHMFGKLDIISHNLQGPINIKFDYCFENIHLGQFRGKAKLYVNNSEKWNSESNSIESYVNCENPKQVEICNLNINSETDTTLITFINVPQFHPLDFYTSSSFKLDNISISQSNALSSEELTSNYNYVVYPNPANSNISILGKEELKRYEIINIYGQIIKEGSANKSIDIIDLQNGIYFLKLIDYENRNPIAFVKHAYH